MSFITRTIIEFASESDLENALKIDTTPFLAYLGLPTRPTVPVDGLKIVREWQVLDSCHDYVNWTSEQFRIHNINATITVQESA